MPKSNDITITGWKAVLVIFSLIILAGLLGYGIGQVIIALFEYLFKLIL